MIFQVNRILCYAFIVSSFAVLAGCANQGVSRQDVNQTINIQYGNIESIEQVKLQSNAAGGAVGGSILGAVNYWCVRWRCAYRGGGRRQYG